MSGFGAFLGGLSGGTIGASVVSLILETKKFDAGLVSAKGRLTQATATMDTQTSKFSQAAKAGLAIAGIAFVKFAADGVRAAIEAQEAQNKLANSIENSTEVSGDAAKAFTAQADALRDLTGVDDEAIIGAQAFLVQMGLTQQQVGELIPRVVDLSVKLGIDLETAAKAVGKSVNGTTAGLQRMGVVVDKTKAQTDAYGATLEALGAVQGFAARQAKAEPWRVLGAQYEEIAEQVGTALLPFLRDLAGVLKAALPVLAALVKPALAFGIALGTWWTIGKLGSLAGAIGKLSPALTSLATSAAAAAGPIGAVVAGIIGLGVLAQSTGTTVENEFTQTLIDAGFKAEEAAKIIDDKFGEAMRETGGNTRGAWNEVRTFVAALVEGQPVAESWAARQAAVAAQTEAAGGAAAQAGRKFHRFANLTKEGLQDLREQAKSDLAAVVGSVDGFQRKWSFTATSFNNRVEAMRIKSRELRTTMEQFSKLKGVPEDFQAWLLEQGPDAIKAFVDSSKGGRTDIIADWKAIDRNTKASKGAIDDVTTAIGKVKTKMNELDGKTADVTVRLHLEADPRIPDSLVDDALSDALVRGQTSD